MVPNVICSGFKQSGIYPFNSQTIDYGVVTKTSTTQENFNAIDLSHEQVQLFEKMKGTTYQILFISSG